MLRCALSIIALCVLSVLCVEPAASAQEPSGPQPVSADQLKAAIDRLGDPITTRAPRRLARFAEHQAAQAVPALLQAVAEHADGYVRYRALVLLTGFNDPRTRDAMRESLTSPNDRLRTVAYSFFEHHPDRAMLTDLLGALDKELAEFVRPALVRALAAHGSDARVQSTLIRDVGRGEDFFRSVVIEALGDHKAGYAYDAIAAVAKLDGPLQDDSAVALGKIGDKRALEVLASLQGSAPRTRQPAIATSICLLGVNCGSHEGYLINILRFADQKSRLSGPASRRGRRSGALALSGRAESAQALFTTGIPSRDPTRAPIALALATVALRNTPLMLSILEKHTDRANAIALVGEGFDMLEEDLDKERFFAMTRRTYWESKEGSPTRELMQTLIGKLAF